MASLVLISLLTLSVYLVQTSKPELVVQNESATTRIIKKSQTLQTDHQPETTNEVAQPLLASTTNIYDLEPHLEKLLHQLEESYELGKVENIEPILFNTPNISGQSSEQITAKLKSLFEITQERKMLLYGFSWKKVANTIQGEGKFLSRYQFTNENQWQTREGVAVIHAENKDNSLKIISLELNNSTLEQ
jgi:hypothetical protein